MDRRAIRRSAGIGLCLLALAALAAGVHVLCEKPMALTVPECNRMIRAAAKNGKVLQIGTPFEIYESPATEFVARFIGDTHLFDSRVIECAKHGDEYMVTLDVPELGKQIKVTDYDETQNGQQVSFTVRPEKIMITLEEPHTNGKELNVFRGVVEEPVYSGFQ